MHDLHLKKYSLFAKYITEQKINIILTVVGMIEEQRKWNRTNIENYIEIYIQSTVKDIIKLNKKKIYHKKNPGKLIGINIKPQYPKKPDIMVVNSFTYSIFFSTIRLLRFTTETEFSPWFVIYAKLTLLVFDRTEIYIVTIKISIESISIFIKKVKFINVCY